MIRTEKDLREFLRKLAKSGKIGELFWIEPKQGSTIGLPDCFFYHKNSRSVVFLELKCSANVEKPSIRPAQVAFMRKFRKTGVKMYLVVAEKESNRVVVYDNDVLDDKEMDCGTSETIDSFINRINGECCVEN